MPESSPLAATASDDLPSDPLSNPLFDAVARAIKVIRPAVQANQGDIFLKDVDGTSGVVSVELVGACVSCASTAETVRQSVERILKQRVEGVTEVRHTGESSAGPDQGTAVSLRPTRHASPPARRG